MLLDKTFDLFKKVKTGTKRDYKTTKEYTARCKIEPVALGVEVWLDNAPALEAWKLHTETLEIDVEDKVVIDWLDYIVNSTKKYQWILKNNCVSLIKRKYD